MTGASGMADPFSLWLAARASRSGDRSDIRSSLLVVVVGSIASYGNTTSENDEMDTRYPGSRRGTANRTCFDPSASIPDTIDYL
jgi:hypothetical protein